MLSGVRLVKCVFKFTFKTPTFAPELSHFTLSHYDDISLLFSVNHGDQGELLSSFLFRPSSSYALCDLLLCWQFEVELCMSTRMRLTPEAVKVESGPPWWHTGCCFGYICNEAVKGKSVVQLTVGVPTSSTTPPSFVSATGRRSVKLTIKRVDGKGSKCTKGR